MAWLLPLGTLAAFRAASAGSGGLANVHGEHDDLGRHGAHLVGEAVAVDAVHVGGEGVLAVALPLAAVHDLADRQDMSSLSPPLNDYARLSPFRRVPQCAHRCRGIRPRPPRT